MSIHRKAHQTNTTAKLLWYGAVVLCLMSAPLFAVAAQGAETAPAPGTAPLVTAPPPAVVPTKPLELQEVEAVFGGNLSRQYQRYEAILSYNPSFTLSFAQYLHDQFASGRRAGLIMAGVVAPILALFTVFGNLWLYSRGHDDGGFCNHTTYDAAANRYCRDCEGDRGEIAGMVLISIAGTAAFLGLFIPGIIKFAKNNKRLRRISPLVAQ
jgi:hypothetical protein